jgi:hypothetical protein
MLSAALARYESVIERQGVARLPELDRGYRRELPPLIAVEPRPTSRTRSDLIP